jgi:hypothetical protein
MATALNRGLRSGIRLLANGAEASKPGKTPRPLYDPIGVSVMRFASRLCGFGCFVLMRVSAAVDLFFPWKLLG